MPSAVLCQKWSNFHAGLDPSHVKDINQRLLHLIKVLNATFIVFWGVSDKLEVEKSEISLNLFIWQLLNFKN